MFVQKGLKIPKFHDKASLWIGSVAGFSVSIISVIGLFDKMIGWLLILPVVVGLVLGVHCLDMLRYWKKHRIVKIVKTDTEKLIYKESFKNQES